MNFKALFQKIVIGLIVLGGVAVVVSNIFNSSSGPVIVEVTVPRLSQMASRGETSFNENCAQCHGENAAGSEAGPPLVYATYNPGHHADEAFVRAVKGGVRRHHWNFGNMPPQPEVNDLQLKNIIAYVRELQNANGIVYKEHSM